MRFAGTVALVILLFVPLLAGAQGASGGVNTGSTDTILINPLNMGECSSVNGACLTAFLASILEFVVRIGAIVVILMLVYVGYEFVVARGNATAISNARRSLLWTVIGALILLGAQVISLGIQATVQSLSVGG